jgi:hypothetical protein
LGDAGAAATGEEITPNDGRVIEASGSQRFTSDDHNEHKF